MSAEDDLKDVISNGIVIDIYNAEEASSSADTLEKRPFTEPKLTFVTPKLVKHGDLVTVTGVFGTFSP